MPGGGLITAKTRIVLAPPQKALERRLVLRWLAHGLPPEQVPRRAWENDTVIAATVQDLSVVSDLVMAQA